MVSLQMTHSNQVVIDGGFGEGGGQIVRTSLTLSAALGRPVRIENIRPRRPRPGLAAQHLSAARAVAKVCGGTLEGAKKGASTLALEPGAIRPGHYTFEIGTAGSTTLIFQTLLPVLAAANYESAIMITGGTHNPKAPPPEFISESFLPAIRTAGFSAKAELLRPGFYPKGGGAIRAVIKPFSPGGSPLDLTAPVEWKLDRVTILIANLPDHVAHREAMEISERLGLDQSQIEVEALPGEVGPGNAIIFRCVNKDRAAVITSYGEPGKRAERVAQEGAREARQFMRGQTPVDLHLADQLILPLALGPGGAFITNVITEHARTQVEVINKFFGDQAKIEMIEPERFRVEVKGAGILPMGPQKQIAGP